MITGDLFRRAARRDTLALGRIDDVRFIDTLVRDVDPDGTGKVPQGASLFVRGWGLVPDPPRPGAGLVVSVGPDFEFEPGYGVRRPDIATHYGDPALAACGFIGVQSLAGLPAGSRELVVAVLDGAGGYHDLLRRSFEMTPSRLAVAGKPTAPDGRMQISIDNVATLRDANAYDAKRGVRARVGDVVYVRGWAIDVEAGNALGGVYGVFDGAEYTLGVHGLPRLDAATAIGLPQARRCGFTLRIPTRNMKPGSHRLEAAVLTSQGTHIARKEIATVELLAVSG